ncbi:hypothetical protein [Streptomyces sp. NBC_01465]|uniref:hypothetical protein n=1 Tax=Streptomyces sp. NBC_01465 TaxID=2903878 RepID=UPI002E35E015|nr:hypothetical protein [Streptomyces sp. NBC_01465]
MSSPRTLSPSPAATVVRTTGRASKLIAIGTVLAAIGLLCLIGGIAMLAGGSARGAGAVVMGLLFLFFAAIPLVSVRNGRGLRVSLDETGFWLERGAAQGLIRWDSLAGAGVHWSTFGRRTKVYSLELYPTGPIDRDDPVLWTLVRDEDPLAPQLPRLRYRFPFDAAARDQLTAAVQRHAPQLWLGETERATGHIGTPDRKGHVQRTAARKA